MRAYRLVAALWHIFDIKVNGGIDSPASTDRTSDDGVVASVGVFVSTQELELAKKICTGMLTPQSCKIPRSFDRNLNAVS